MRRIFVFLLKGLSFIVSFIIIFLAIQPFFVPQYIGDSTTIVDGYSYIEDNSVDVLFLGASQMFCSVDAGRLIEKYGISSYDFGASSQTISIAPFYFDKALQTQTPKLVMIEVCQIFSENKNIDAPTISWSYDPMDTSIEKFNSLYNILGGDKVKAMEYTYTPLLLYHDRWKEISTEQIEYVFNKGKFIDSNTRGFLSRDHVEPHTIAFFNGDISTKEIPKESENALKYISDCCESVGIKLVLFKAPVSNWTKGDSISVKQFADKNDMEFIDLNEKIDEIGIDGNSDFYNEAHLNTSGAIKTTDYIAKLIPDYLD